jgi:hypothetical protein
MTKRFVKFHLIDNKSTTGGIPLEEFNSRPEAFCDTDAFLAAVDEELSGWDHSELEDYFGEAEVLYSVVATQVFDVEEPAEEQTQ